MVSERERLKEEYSDRENRFNHSDYYSLMNLSNLYRTQSLERNLLQLLRENGFYPLKGFRVLEVGCGNGNVLLDFLTYGVPITQLDGIDLLGFRLREGKYNLPSLQLSCADGQNLPFSPESFDLVLQFTVLSSVLRDEVKVNIAREMLRVLRPGGMILWYDFWLNPTNTQTKGIKPSEIRDLFLGCRFDFHKITLAPPLARRFVPLSWGVAHLIERMGFLNTHYLVAIRPKEKKGAENK